MIEKRQGGLRLRLNLHHYATGYNKQFTKTPEKLQFWSKWAKITLHS